MGFNSLLSTAKYVCSFFRAPRLIECLAGVTLQRPMHTCAICNLQLRQKSGRVANTTTSGVFSEGCVVEKPLNDGGPR